MRGLTGFALHVLQWLLVIFGTMTVLMALTVFRADLQVAKALPALEPGVQSSYDFGRAMHLRLIGGITQGMAGVGVGALLFYFRHLYVRRRGH